MEEQGKEVYIITKGEYSDYHICAVTLDKDRAEQLRKIYTEIGDLASVETFVIDEGRSDLTSLVPIYCVSVSDRGKYTVEEGGYHDMNKGEFQPRYDLKDNMWFRMLLTAKDEDHAVKIALDSRAKIIAERYGL